MPLGSGIPGLPLAHGGVAFQDEKWIFICRPTVAVGVQESLGTAVAFLEPHGREPVFFFSLGLGLAAAVAFHRKPVFFFLSLGLGLAAAVAFLEPHRRPVFFFFSWDLGLAAAVAFLEPHREPAFFLLFFSLGPLP